MTKTLTKTAFLVIRPELNALGNAVGFTPVRVTQKQPRSLSDYETYIQIDLSVPSSAFDPAIRAQIDVPETAVRTIANVEVRDDD